ncbi:MAG: SAM-dependent methyltransferase, partial [Motilibacteraceae bacterium]
LIAFQAGAVEHVDRDTAYGQPVRMTSYRHDPHLVAQVLETEGFELQVELHRGPEGHETTPQSVLLARRPDPL